MSTSIETRTRKPTRMTPKRIASVAAVVAVLGAIALDTTVVRIGSENDVRQQVFSPQAYGAAEFPKVKASIEQRAFDAVEVAQAIAADKKAAGAKYGVPAGIGPVIPVTFTGTVTARKSNYNTVTIAGMPDGITVRVQTGPAINGTDLRDATGTIEFGQFTNQIEYQDAGSALNNEMKKAVLAGLDVENLTGKTITVTGVFKLVNQKAWLVTPVKVETK